MMAESLMLAVPSLPTPMIESLLDQRIRPLWRR